MGNLRALHLQALPRRDVHGRSACMKHALERVEQSQDRLPRRRRRQQQLLKREHIPHFLHPREGKFEGSRDGHALAEGRGSGRHSGPILCPPQLQICQELSNRPRHLSGYDPEASSHLEQTGRRWCQSKESSAQGPECRADSAMFRSRPDKFRPVRRKWLARQVTSPDGVGAAVSLSDLPAPRPCGQQPR